MKEQCLTKTEHKIRVLIRDLKYRLSELEEELEQIEFEPCPSGEMNESVAIMAPLESEISSLKYVIGNLENIIGRV